MANSPQRPHATALAGKRIVVTRAAGQSASLVNALQGRGAEVLQLPLVHFAPPEDSAALDDAIHALHSFDAILFLSANAVRYFFERCRHLGVAFQSPAAPKRLVGAVGPATARALGDEGVSVVHIAREYTGETLARELKDSLAGRSVLLPRSDRGNEAVGQVLRQGGARVTEVIAYRTAMPGVLDAALLERIRRGEVDAVIFASPSAVENFVVAMGADRASEIAKRVSFAAIGPTTAQALRDRSLAVAVEAAESSADGLAGAMAAFFERQAETVRHSK